MIVVDASVLIGHLDGADAQHDRAVSALLAIADEPLGASPVTLAEVLAGPARTGRLQAAQDALGELGVVEIAPGPNAPARLAVMRVQTKLKLPACCVLLAAEDAGAVGIATFDERLAACARRAGVGAAS